MAYPKKESSDTSEERPKGGVFREFSLESVFKNGSDCDEKERFGQLSPFYRRFPISPTITFNNTGLYEASNKFLSLKPTKQEFSLINTNTEFKLAPFFLNDCLTDNQQKSTTEDAFPQRTAFIDQI